MGLQSSVSVFRRRGRAFPFYGTGPIVPVAQKNGSLILSLQFRGTEDDRLNPSVVLSAPDLSTTMYYAYPVEFGLATFTDNSNGFQGGWDGAHGDHGTTLGPIVVPVTIDDRVVDFYLYETDWPDLGPVDWAVS